MNSNPKLTAPTLPLVEIERSLVKTYRKDTFKLFVRAIDNYELIKPKDKIAVAISGGKDSLILAKLFQALKRVPKYDFELCFIAMDPGFNETNLNQMKLNCDYLGIPLEIKKSEIFQVIDLIAKESPCYLCARMRRGFLYNAAKELGCNKIALGHHFDDVIETTLLNVFYGAQFKTMVPKIKAKNFLDIELIRPMVLIKEHDIIRWKNHAGINAMDCGCAITSKKTSSKRNDMKILIKTLKKTNKDIDKSIFNAATHVNLDAVYGYEKENETFKFNQIYSERNKEK